MDTLVKNRVLQKSIQKVKYFEKADRGVSWLQFKLNKFFECSHFIPIKTILIEEGILEAKTECYAKDKVKSPQFFRSFYDNF